MTEETRNAAVPYMQRTRNYYRALGYDTDYVWSHFEQVPFTRLAKPLAESRVALITTASPPESDNLDAAGNKLVWSGDVAPPPPGLTTHNLAWDKESTHTDDRESYLPIEAANALARDGVFAGLAARFHGVPTEYSHRKVSEQDAPALLARLREDGADAALLCAL